MPDALPRLARWLCENAPTTYDWDGIDPDHHGVEFTGNSGAIADLDQKINLLRCRCGGEIRKVDTP